VRIIFKFYVERTRHYSDLHHRLGFQLARAPGNRQPPRPAPGNRVLYVENISVRGPIHNFVLASYLEAAIGIEPMNKGFADLCLTTWLRRPTARMKNEGGRMKKTLSISVPSLQCPTEPPF